MNEIYLALIAIVAAPLSALLTSLFMRGRAAAEVDKLRTEVRQMQSDVRSRELDNDKKAISMIMELVVEPVRRDMKLLQKKLDRLNHAIEKIPSCSYADTCPVSRELRQSEQDGDNVQPTTGEHPSDRRTAAEDVISSGKLNSSGSSPRHSKTTARGSGIPT